MGKGARPRLPQAAAGTAQPATATTTTTLPSNGRRSGAGGALSAREIDPLAAIEDEEAPVAGAADQRDAAAASDLETHLGRSRT